MKKDLLIIKENLKALSDLEQLNRSVLLSQIEEAVYLIKNKSLEFNQAVEVFKGIFALPLLSEDFMKFCDCLSSSDYFKQSNKTFSNGKLKSVSMMDNLYNKEAYRNFSSYDMLIADFENSFTSVCEALYSKRCNYALLPMFNSRDGLMISIYKLLQKYELKIVATTKIFVNNGETETEFVLAANSENNSNQAERIMISLTHNYDNTVSDLLNAMKVVGAAPITINTIPLEYTDERCESLITFDISLCSMNTICSFIKASLPEANIVGIYSLVK